MLHSQKPMVLTAILTCLLIIKIIDVTADHIYYRDVPKGQNYPIEGVQNMTKSSQSSQPEEPEALDSFMKTADIDRGKKIAQKCVQCHIFTKDGGNRVGPNLWNVFGAKFAHMANFIYSKSFQELKGVWNIKSLNEFLYKPSQFVKGTKMSFAGLKNPQDRADVIKYIHSMSNQPKELK